MKSKISVLISIILSVLVSSMDATIMNTTMPVIAESLGGFDLFAWVFSSYMIASTVSALIVGRLSDVFGRKKIFGFGIVWFLITSCLCGLSQTMEQLVVFRALQGVGGGFLLSLPAIVTGDLFSVEQRGKVQALGTGMWGLSAVLAPLLGAFFVEYMTWRWIFYVNIPICIIALITLLPYRENHVRKKVSVDYIGALLLSVGVSVLLLVTVVDSGQIIYGLIGALVIVGFYFYERKQTSPLIPFFLFRDHTLRWMNINGFLSWVALFGTASYIPLFLQKIAHLSVITSGLALLGTAVGWITTSTLSGKWILKYGYRPLFIIGNLFLTFSGILFFLMQREYGFVYVFFALFIQGLGFGLLSTISVIGAQQLVPVGEKGISTSFALFIRNIGGAAGVTIMGAILDKSANFMNGIHELFLYGLVGSVIALLTAFFIKERQQSM
ncbi:MAG TPA: MFS transporter [Brevibacillus sp.]|nr:MFS transporter [Brevibacillus sp.]